MSTNGSGKTREPHAKKINLDTDLTPFTKKKKSKWITDIKHRAIKLLDDNIGENLDDLEYGKDLVDTTPKP